MRLIFLILVGFTSLVNAINIDNFSRSNGIVNDGITNLEWQDDYSDNNNSIKETTWQSAINYCEDLTLEGKSDWRLPNLNELISLVDDAQYNPSINGIFHNNDSSNSYWSSTSKLDDNVRVWLVNFYSGTQPHVYKGSNYSVRCVRAGQ